ncbi:MAG TPA: PQQ-binding-like beta-propeller repeat protein [Mycobacteriales bacterium]|nr:PQQ-binding-like beta-propeller repeat protein [Mycobacteriales bacterium]
MDRPHRLVGLLVVTALAAACSGSPSSTGSGPVAGEPGPGASARLAASSNPTSAWPTYHRTNNRVGDAGSTAAWLSGSSLHKHWDKRLDGAVYGQPVLVGSNAVVATENNTVYSLSVSTGAVLWSRHLGTPVPRSALPCGNIDPLGITGTPAYDLTTGSVFVVAETTGGVHTLYALAATTGAVRWHRGLDVYPNRDRKAEQQRSALMVTSGRVITSFGGLAGDCGNYVGYLTSVPATGVGATTKYAVPTQREGGMWAAGGQAVGANHLVYAASGNGAGTSGTWDGSDSVLALNPTTMARVYAYRPSTWADDNVRDLDLGSLAPVVVAGRILIAGKRGVVYLLTDHLVQLTSRDGCVAFGGAAVRGSVVYLPCTDGLRAVKVGTSSLSFLWQRPGVPGSPALSGPVAYALNPGAQRLYEISLSSGGVRLSLDLGTPISRFASPTIANGGHTVLVPTMTGVIAVT